MLSTGTGDAAEVTPPVETASGKVQGRRSGGVSRFLGIPYGQDTARCRFRPAAPRAPWAGVRDCAAFGPQAPQGRLNMGHPATLTPFAKQVIALFTAGMQQGGESEDCLVLNVFTPEASPRRRRPVMVWLHGGGFVMGSGADPQYDGGALCERGDVVVVTLNHRLGALGYLYLGGLGPEFAESGNVGQLDIILALQWVRRNIEAFGGDPENVTIFGESGGGKKAAVLLAMKAAAGLFHKAIIQSSPNVALDDRQGAEALAERTLATLGIAKPDKDRLLHMDCRAIIKVAGAAERPGQMLQPVVDDVLLTGQPFSPAAPAISADIPLIIGTNRDEATLFFAASPEFGTMTEEEARRQFETMLGPKAEAAFALYRGLRPHDPPTYWVTALMTDRMMRMDSIQVADRKAAQPAPVYMYRLDWNTPILGGAMRCPHGLDVPLVFDNVAAKRSILGPGEAPELLAAVMSRAWIGFAQSGDPSQPGLAWPRYGAARETMLFDTQSRAVADPDGPAQRFWNG